MKKVVRKFFPVWGHQKEEEWLNEMSKEGWQLVEVRVPKYTFIEAEPNEYTYRLEFLDVKLDAKQRKEYIEFVESTEAEEIGSCGNWIYLSRKSMLGEFELFSDIDSQINHYRRMSMLMKILLVSMFPIMMMGITFAN